MAAKPTIANARWGEDAAGVVGANDTIASSGLRDTGYATNAVAVSSYYNRTLREHYLWCKYLDEGELAGDFEFADNVDVLGVLTAATLAAGPATLGNTEVANLEVTGDLSVTGGDLILSNDLKHGTRTKKISAWAGKGADESAVGSLGANGAAVSFSVSTAFYIPVNLLEGDRILAIRARINDGSSTTAQIALFKTNDGTTTQVGSTATSAGDDSWQTLTIGSLTETVPSDNTTFYHVEYAHASGSASIQIAGIEVDYDRPV